MAALVTFTGSSGSGKTTILSKVVSNLKDRGYKVATIKHDGHGHDIYNYQGDSGIHKKAGATCSIVSNKKGYNIACDNDRDMTPHELAALVPADIDIIIFEGFKSYNDIDKIEVCREKYKKDRANIGDEKLVAVVTDYDVQDNVTKFNIDDTDEIATFLVNNYKLSNIKNIQLIVNGKYVATKEFIQLMLYNSINGLIKPLRGCDEPKEIIIKAKYEN